MTGSSRIILLNGVGSAGKTSIAKALQSILDDPYLHVQMDVFLNMLPERFQDHLDSFSYEVLHDRGKPYITIHSGPVGERTLRGMRHAVAAMAAQGNNLIIDDVLIGIEKIEYAQLLRPFGFYLVGVFASLNVLEARERQRGDRLIGLARWQFDKVHHDMVYDSEVSTDAASPLECAQQIINSLGL